MVTFMKIIGMIIFLDLFIIGVIIAINSKKLGLTFESQSLVMLIIYFVLFLILLGSVL